MGGEADADTASLSDELAINDVHELLGQHESSSGREELQTLRAKVQELEQREVVSGMEQVHYFELIYNCATADSTDGGRRSCAGSAWTYNGSCRRQRASCGLHKVHRLRKLLLLTRMYLPRGLLTCVLNWR